MRILYIFDLSTFKLVDKLDIPTDRDDQPQVLPTLHQMCFSPDSARLWACSGTHCHLLSWDMVQRKTLPLSFYHSGGVSALRLDTEGKTITTLGYDHCVYQWDCSSGEIRGKVEVGHHSCLAQSPDGRVIAIANNGISSLWTGNDLIRHKDNLSEISLISSKNGELITKLKGHLGGVWNLAFSADGKQLYSLGLDTTIVIWDTSPWAK
jgi:WD40 repeat protein